MSTGKTVGSCDYDPEDRQSLPVNEWLIRIETFAQSSGLSEDQKYCFARGKLKGIAKAWINGESKVTCWSDFKREIQKRFPQSFTEIRFARVVPKRKIQKGESVEKVLTDIVLQARKHQISEKTLVEHIISTIDGSLSTETRQQPIQDLEQLMTLFEMKKFIHSQNELDNIADEMEISVVDDVISTTSIPKKLIRIMIKNSDAILQRLYKIFNRFRSSVSVSSYDIGTSKTHELVINVDSPEANEFHKNENPVDHSCLQNLLKKGIIRRSHSTFYNKYLHNKHLLLDLRILNSKAEQEPVDLISVETLLDALPYFRFFTTLTFNGGHLQIPIQEASRKYFAFSTSCGHYEYCKAPKEFINTGSVFNKILIEVAKKLDPGEAVVLFDELIIPSASIEEGYHKLEKVMATLGAFGLTIDLNESIFFAEELILFNWRLFKGRQIYVGFQAEIGSKNDRLLEHLSMPDNQVLNRDCDLQIQTWKRSSKIDLRYEFEIKMVHSQCQILCILMQRRNKNETNLLGIYNRYLSSEEQSFKAAKIGILAVVESALHFKQFLRFKPFKIVTSNRKFYSTMKKCNLTNDYLRHLLTIQNMRITVVLEPVTGKSVNTYSLFETK
ncbi:uncharacterized protein LOC129765700 [Toxorhynchites rutilus septentrionalis]|uniref:uncharacterized protein LOC129765700 n=1 Tax=Toxorhynchites rutilus septentrionalis TaxID=329112 RepID=UPI00247A85EB|nr:uncharacterized protein LOC129765700 [Toxorhynchites rutilus septentrionalis]